MTGLATLIATLAHYGTVALGVLFTALLISAAISFVLAMLNAR